MDIREHPLAWRWTDPNYAVLPPEVLARMIPYSCDEAASLFRHSLRFNCSSGLSRDRYQSEIAFAESMSSEEGTIWLRSRPVSESTPVYLSWQPNTAIRTDWGVFADYWSEFCYGSSDDLNVWPEDESWVFLFHHNGEFHFGIPNKSRAEQGAPSKTDSRLGD